MNAQSKKRIAGMTNSQIATMLSALKPAFLEGLSSAEVESILAGAAWKRHAANSLITREGDMADQLFLVLEGGARYYTMSPQGKKIIVSWIRPGEVIGGASLLSKRNEYVMSAETVKKCSALAWNRTVIRSLSADSPRLLENALLLAYDYLLHFRIRHVALSCDSAPQRVAQVLGYLAKEMGQKVSKGIELHIKNEELAHEANVTIFTVSRLMGEWHRKGLLTKGRGSVVVTHPDKLIHLRA
jgi:CRP/FNR family transcriptional regulator, nitrogen oxide reductase regulator